MSSLNILADSNSRYCCLNSILHAWINALAWCAVISNEMLNDLFVHSPNRGACCPVWVSSSFYLINSLKQENCYE